MMFPCVLLTPSILDSNSFIKVSRSSRIINSSLKENLKYNLQVEIFFSYLVSLLNRLIWAEFRSIFRSFFMMNLLRYPASFKFSLFAPVFDSKVWLLLSICEKFDFLNFFPIKFPIQTNLLHEFNLHAEVLRAVEAEPEDDDRQSDGEHGEDVVDPGEGPQAGAAPLTLPAVGPDVLGPGRRHCSESWIETAAKISTFDFEGLENRPASRAAKRRPPVHWEYKHWPRRRMLVERGNDSLRPGSTCQRDT